jgi:hypothetical protein
MKATARSTTQPNDDRRSGSEHDLARRTIDDFGEQWSHFPDSSGFFGSAALLATRLVRS